MSNDTVLLHSEEEALRYYVSDEEVEAAAAPAAMTYTYQTSAYNRCCR
jgi:hypothetical protein